MKHRCRILMVIMLTLVLLAPLTVRAQRSTVHEGPITLYAAKRGNPWINLLDGRDLPAAYTGPASLTQALTKGQAQPLSLASADFDEDGVPDVVSGYAVDRNQVFVKNLVSNGGGILTLHRGNVDSIYPNAPEAQKRKAEGTFTDAPFLTPARVFALPVAPDFLGAGDFDADGHWDVVAAAHRGEALHLLSGDGQGGFGPAQETKLPGKVTALVVGEINRRDGLADVVVGVIGAKKPQVLVFEGPEGALRWEPEVLVAPAEVTALVLGQMDDHYAMDLAVSAGRELLIVHGRDRKLSLDVAYRGEVPTATVDHVSLPFASATMALGSFVPERGYPLGLALLAEDGVVHVLDPTTGEEITQHAISSVQSLGYAQDKPPIFNPHLIRARVSSLPTDDLVVVDPANRQVHVVVTVERGTTKDEDGMWIVVQQPWSVALDVVGEPVAVLPMRLNVDALSDLVVIKRDPAGLTVSLTAPVSTFTVVSTADKGDECATDNGICAATEWQGPAGDRVCSR